MGVRATILVFSALVLAAPVVAQEWWHPSPKREPTPWNPREPASSEDRRGARDLLEPGYGTTPAVGILLPLSGSYEQFGQSAYRGVRLALGATDDAIPSVRMLVRDTEADVGKTVRQLESLVADPSVVAVIGPMASAGLDAISARARSAGIPVVSLSTRDPEMPGSVYPVTMRQSDQARVLADRGVGEMGLHRWAVVYPRDRFGSTMSLEFRRAVSKRGGSVLAVAGLEREAVDFQTELAQLRRDLGLPPMKKEKPPGAADDARQRDEPKEPLPIDGIFIPERSERVPLVVPQLAFFDLRGLPLYGTNGWNDADALRDASPHVEGAVFVDVFFLYSFLPSVRNFVDAYRDAFGENPGAIDAVAFDAAAIVRELVEDGATDRIAMGAALRRPASWMGATGRTRFLGDGTLEKDLFLLEFSDGSVREIERPASAPGLRGRDLEAQPAAR